MAEAFGSGAIHETSLQVRPQSRCSSVQYFGRCDQRAHRSCPGIAGQLEIRVKTVETYKTRSLEKLGLHSRADLVRYALHRGWLHEM